MLNLILRASADASVGFTTDPVDFGENVSGAYEIIFTGVNVAGTLTLEASADKTDWPTVENSAMVVAGSGKYLYDINRIGPRYVRVKWTYSSGVGNVVVWVNVKDIELATNSILAKVSP